LKEADFETFEEAWRRAVVEFRRVVLDQPTLIYEGGEDSLISI
jgi:hypothetical protein